MRFRQGILLAALCALGLTGLAGLAGADTMSFTDPAGDVTGGGGPDYDIVRATQGHRGAFLFHTTKTRAPHTDDSPGPEMFIKVGAGRKPDFRVTGAGVYRINTGSAARKVGNASLEIVSPRVFGLLFRPAAINNPRKYQWRIYLGAPGLIDRAPAHYVTHVLR
jgi:hypothetical protein